MKKVCDRASDKKLELMSQAAVMAALTAALTLWLHIPAGLNGGYIHFGTGHPADQAASRPSLFKRRRADRD